MQIRGGSINKKNTIFSALLRYNASVGALGTVHVLKLNGKPFGAAPATVRRQALCLAFIKNHWVFSNAREGDEGSSASPDTGQQRGVPLAHCVPCTVGEGGEGTRQSNLQ